MRPKVTDECAACHHTFGAHYVRHDKVQGCAGPAGDYDGQRVPCFCANFAIPWKPDRDDVEYGAQQWDR